MGTTVCCKVNNMIFFEKYRIVQDRLLKQIESGDKQDDDDA